MLVSRCGATSFEDLRTVDNVLHTTHKSSCIAAGLLEDTSQWIICLQEASLTNMTRGIRDLSVVIIYACQPADPIKIFNQFKDFIMEDFVQRQTTNGMNQLKVSLLSTNNLLRHLDKDFTEVENLMKNSESQSRIMPTPKKKMFSIQNWTKVQLNILQRTFFYSTQVSVLHLKSSANKLMKTKLDFIVRMLLMEQEKHY